MNHRHGQVSWRGWILGLTLVSSACLAPQGFAQIGPLGPPQHLPGGSKSGPALRPIKTIPVAQFLNRPIYATYAPGDTSRLFIVEQRGVIKILDLATLSVLATEFLNIDPLVTGPSSSSDERGLLGMAFHPNYDVNGLFYVYYYNNTTDTVLVEYAVSANPNVADAASARILLNIGQPQSNHNGGWIGFKPLGSLLYVAVGDGGASCDNATGHTAGVGNAQDITSNLLGKMLRIDPLGTNGPGGQYGIPASNPFVGVTGDDEIWAYGLRNPWRSSFDRMTGDLYIADVGQGVEEEIDFEPFSSTGGVNYGWRCMEGFSCSSVSGCSGSSACTCGSGLLTSPVHSYTHSFGCSVTGGYVYRGPALPELFGYYLFADYCSARIWKLRVQGGTVVDHSEITSQLSPSIGGLTVNQISSFAEDASGEMYIIDRGTTTTGTIFKLVRG